MQSMLSSQVATSSAAIPCSNPILCARWHESYLECQRFVYREWLFLGKLLICERNLVKPFLVFNVSSIKRFCVGVFTRYTCFIKKKRLEISVKTFTYIQPILSIFINCHRYNAVTFSLTLIRFSFSISLLWNQDVWLKTFFFVLSFSDFLFQEKYWV